MSKRVADKYLTDQNWDQQDDDYQEEVVREGFQKADDEILKTRVIRKAKRRVVGSKPCSSSAFSGFTGLKPPSTDNKTFTRFSLPDANNKSLSVHHQFQGFENVSSSEALSEFKLHTSSGGITTLAMNLFPSENKSAFNAKCAAEAKFSDDDEGLQNSKEYNRHLAALNKSVSRWIKSHVEKNPVCDLTPIFNDYKKHLLEIDEKFCPSDNETPQNSASNSQQSSSRNSLNASEKSMFSLSGFSRNQNGSKEDLSSQTDLSSAKPLFGGFSTSSVHGANAIPFNGCDTSKPAPILPGFSFGSSVVAGNKEGMEDEYVPPKPESSIVEEEDAFFMIRCKLYYKKGETFADKGVGQLYLKPSNGKTQLLVRAGTAIGHILLNILLQPSMPMIRQGRNNVIITCIPNPAVDKEDKVVPMLIRVKTGEDADRLFKTMQEKKLEVGVETAAG